MNCPPLPLPPSRHYERAARRLDGAMPISSLYLATVLREMLSPAARRASASCWSDKGLAAFSNRINSLIFRLI